MKLNNQRVILTGACGGIGAPLATLLAASGCRLLLVDRDDGALNRLRDTLDGAGDIEILATDITSEAGRNDIITRCQQCFNGVDVLINLAGVMQFGAFANEDSRITETLFAVNVLAPMALCRAVIPLMKQNGHGRIVNIGSIFGSIAFAFFSSYSATKFAMRGFSEALRRELAGSGIDVCYIAPRATRTPFNTDAVYKMSAKVKMNFDEPGKVAEQIQRAIVTDAKEYYIGQPESFFVRLNALWPRLVDRALRKQNTITETYTPNTEQHNH